jgi:hypothetical protein
MPFFWIFAKKNSSQHNGVTQDVDGEKHDVKDQFFCLQHNTAAEKKNRNQSNIDKGKTYCYKKRKKTPYMKDFVGVESIIQKDEQGHQDNKNAYEVGKFRK